MAGGVLLNIERPLTTVNNVVMISLLAVRSMIDVSEESWEKQRTLAVNEGSTTVPISCVTSSAPAWSSSSTSLLPQHL